MKQLKKILIPGLALMLLTFGGAMAGDMDHPGGGSHSSMEHPSPSMGEMDRSAHGQGMGNMEHLSKSHDMEDMGHSGHMGENIRKATVDGYTFSYHLIDMQKKMKEMKAAGHQHEMKMTHHLMVYISDAEGNTVPPAKVGYLVESPDGSIQKAMCMGMSGGYGADVDFSISGTYNIKSKMVMGNKKIMDAFSYKVE